MKSSALTLGCRSTSQLCSDSDDLYDAGMTSHASVEVMLALEEGFDVEFPDAMLKRSVFASVINIANAISQIDQAAAA